ncbi:hypothetical protein EJD97_018792, partial [Solanum chilense]
MGRRPHDDQNSQHHLTIRYLLLSSEELPDVVHVIPNHLYKLQTRRSWEYLGLSTSSPPTNLLNQANMGDGIIITVLDTSFPLSFQVEG